MTSLTLYILFAILSAKKCFKMIIKQFLLKNGCDLQLKKSLKDMIYYFEVSKKQVYLTGNFQNYKPNKKSKETV